MRQVDVPEDETYFEQAIRETEEAIRDAERELERLRRQLAWLIQHRPKPDDGQLSLAIDLGTNRFFSPEAHRKDAPK